MKAHGEGSGTAVRDGQQVRRGCAALSERRSGGGVSAVGRVSVSQVRWQEPRAAMLTASMVAMSLLLGTVVATWQAFRATEQRDRASRPSRPHGRSLSGPMRKPRQCEPSMTSSIRTCSARLIRNTRQIATSRCAVVLNRASKQIDNRFADEPLVKAALHHTLGTTYDSLGLSEEALKHLTEACAIFKRELGPEDPHTLVSLNNLALVYASRDRLKEAADLLRQVMDIQRRRPRRAPSRHAPQHEQPRRFTAAARVFQRGRTTAATSTFYPGRDTRPGTSRNPLKFEQSRRAATASGPV